LTGEKTNTLHGDRVASRDHIVVGFTHDRFESWSIVQAGLEVSFVIVSGESVEETRGELSDLIGSHNTFSNGFESGLNWSNSKSSDVGNFIASIEEPGVIPVGFETGDIGVDLISMSCVVKCDFACESYWFLEDGRP